ncbi:FUSC family membrane protein [Flavobacterium dauae]|uniref:FUSC family protein n=1 Tax=Flavobacterium dauae TaxID=1563479 RepID=UPI00101B2996|nr:FUSC family membrane protein [Flavobacterium dauae]WLD24932.1 FUSC family membrane protein [Flavobacterium dauae]
MFDKFILKFGDNQFYNAIKITFTAIVSFFIFYSSAGATAAFTVTLGALLCAPIDISSNFKHKVIGLLMVSVLIPLISFILTYTYNYFLIFAPVFCLLVFFSAFISLYGHRANLLSFTLLLTISLSFIHHDKPEILLTNCIYLLLGGLFYTFVSILFYFIKPNRYINLEVAECIEITGDYLDLRAQLWQKDTDREKINRQMLEKQVRINELHEHIREYLVYNKARTLNSNNNRKLLVALSSLVEILELAMANTFNHQEFIDFFKNDESVLGEYRTLAKNFSITLKQLSFSIKTNRKYHSKMSLVNDFKRLKLRMNEFIENQNISVYDENAVNVSNLLFYADKQVEKIKGLERVYKERVNADELRGKYRDLEKFFTPEHYRLKTLTAHLNFKSATFRYSLRLTLTMLIGLIVGKIFDFQNAYWILLTIVVIMRPGYGLTKQRSTHRIIGTVIGGILGITALILIDSNVVLSILAIIAMLLGYWFSGIDYKVGVTFVTLYVILIYGLLTNNAESHLVFRILDTSIGALLAFFATRFVWPTWELYSVNTYLEKSLRVIKLYIIEVKYYYIKKGEPTTSYKLARKNAFIEVGNLMASFQRMIQEPRTKQINRAELYELTVLNQTLVSSAASIGTYIQFHKTTEASNAFKLVMDYINNNLSQALHNLDFEAEITDDTEEDFKISMGQLKAIRRQEVEKMDIDDQSKIQKLEESQLIIDQLIWMSNLSEKIAKLTLKMK